VCWKEKEDNSDMNEQEEIKKEGKWVNRKSGIFSESPGDRTKKSENGNMFCEDDRAAFTKKIKERKGDVFVVDSNIYKKFDFYLQKYTIKQTKTALDLFHDARDVDFFRADVIRDNKEKTTNPIIIIADMENEIITDLIIDLVACNEMVSITCAIFFSRLMHQNLSNLVI